MNEHQLLSCKVTARFFQFSVVLRLSTGSIMSKSEPTQRLWLSTSKYLHKHAYHRVRGREWEGRGRGREREREEGGFELHVTSIICFSCRGGKLEAETANRNLRVNCSKLTRFDAYSYIHFSLSSLNYYRSCFVLN